MAVEVVECHCRFPGRSSFHAWNEARIAEVGRRLGLDAGFGRSFGMDCVDTDEFSADDAALREFYARNSGKNLQSR